ncbi:response regulator [Sphingobacterium corticibacterium]|uniref:Response regulator n=1 Tax=Sphingobacterium corticibacterium TaxID=2484746 RepID=A0A4Q6XUK0_9SPHI|nr:response regulator [Sphingobacterium corticibacterium]RZF60297.1 response regulator [Sphingobacterium corticibacterium]
MTRKKIFICDDDKGISEMLEMIFEFIDAETIVETNSINAYERLRQYKPDVLIVDLWMPVISGDLLIQKIRKDRELSNIFILCISASRDGKTIALDAGADMFLPKPFDMDGILSIVEDALKIESAN